MQPANITKKARILLFREADIGRIYSTSDCPAMHVGAILTNAFRLAGLNPVPEAPLVPSMIKDGIRYGCGNSQYAALSVTHGYGFISAALASVFSSRPQIVLHTWKLPWIRPADRSYRLTSRMMDTCLLSVMKRAALVVLATHDHCRLVSAAYPDIPVVFVPVVADTDWWTPGDTTTDILSRLKTKPYEFLLVGGDIDRDEYTPALFAKEMNRKIVRVTRDDNTAIRARNVYKKVGIDAQCVVRIPWTELRDLYRTAWTVLIAPTAKHHPAGLTSLTEALSCGAPVLFPNNETSDGYIENNVNGILYDELNVNSLLSAAELLKHDSHRQVISKNARMKCEGFLNINNASCILADELRKILK